MGHAVAYSTTVRVRLLAVPRNAYVVVGITVAGAVIRFATLGQQSFWAEEAITRSLIERSLGSMLHTVPNSESTPPVYYVLAWFWTHVFGTHEIGLRSLSATLGTLTIPVAYLAAKTLIGREGPSLAVASFVAVSPIMVWYSQESRSYETYTFFSAVSLLFLARAWRDGRRSDFWAWAVAAGLAMASHYCAGFLVVGETVLLVYRYRRRSIPPVFFALLIAVALAPLALYQHNHIDAYRELNGESLHSRIWSIGQRWAFVSYNPGRNVALAIVWTSIAVLVWRARRNVGARVAVFVALTAVGIPILLATTNAWDIFSFRNVISGWIPLAIAVAAGFPDGRRAVLMTAAGCLVLLAPTVAIASKTTLQRDSWRPAVAALRTLPPTSRALVSEDSFTAPQYWPALHVLEAGGVRVREIDYVSRYATATRRFPGLPDFAATSFRIVGNLGFLRLRAPRPELVTPADLPSGFTLMSAG